MDDFIQYDATLKRAIVLSIDRIGANFDVTNNKSSGRVAGLPAPKFSIKARFIGGHDNIDKDDKTYTILPLLDNHIFSIPEKGEIVWCIKDKSNEDAEWYYIGRENAYITRKHVFEEVYVPLDQPFEEEGGGWAFDSAVKGGSDVSWMDRKMDYDKNPNPLYEHPLVRFKPGDVIFQGRSNTLIQQSFNAHSKTKKGYIELVTDRQYIYDDVKEHKNRFIEKSDRRYDRWEYQNSEGSRIVMAGDVNVDRRLINWNTEKEWVPKKKIDDGGPNVGRRFDIHYRDEGPSRLSSNLPDGDYPVIPNREEPWRVHQADWEEYANKKDGEQYNDPLGSEIENLRGRDFGIWDSENPGENASVNPKRALGADRGVWSNVKDTGGFNQNLLLKDAVIGRSRRREKRKDLVNKQLYKYIKGEPSQEREEEFVPFDSQVPTIYFEAEQFKFCSRSGKDMNHAVLGEELVRWAIRVSLDNLHLARTVDLLTTRVNTLALDFAQHTHPTTPPGVPTPPTGSFRGTDGGTGSESSNSEEHPIFNTIMNVIPTTSPEVVSGEDSWISDDLKNVDESGGQDNGPKLMAGVGVTVRDRLKDYRKRISQRMLELPDILSNRFSLN